MPQRPRPSLLVYLILWAIAVALTPLPARAQLQASNVLLVYNSQNAESLAIRNAYLAARPGVRQFDLNSAAANVRSISRAAYVASVRTPVRDFINGVTTGQDLSGQIIAIVTTRGLPGRILSPTGGDEFTASSAWASLESELTLLQQDLEAPGSPIPFRYSWLIDNPYHQAIGAPITSFSRAQVRTARPFVAVQTPSSSIFSWQLTGLTPGDIYLVTRLDAAAGPGTTALDNVLALITRSTSLSLNRCAARALLDEYGAPAPPTGFEFDEDELPPLFAGGPDFENTAARLALAGFRVTHDQAFNFVTGAELPAPAAPLFLLATYGENHSLNAWGEDPPGVGTYLGLYTFHPAAIFIAYESWNGNTLHDFGPRGGQQQALDFIAAGGSFTIPHVMEPFAFAVADVEFLAGNMLVHGLTFAEAAYASLPGLSWQNAPVGDPLARIVVSGGAAPDRDGDGRLTIEDLYRHFTQPQDTDCSGAVTTADAIAQQRLVRADEIADVAPPPAPTR